MQDSPKEPGCFDTECLKQLKEVWNKFPGPAYDNLIFYFFDSDAEVFVILLWKRGEPQDWSNSKI